MPSCGPSCSRSPLSWQGLWQPAPRSQHGRGHHHCGLPMAQYASPRSRPGQQWELCSWEVVGDVASTPGSPQPRASLCRGLRFPNYKMRVAAKAGWGLLQPRKACPLLSVSLEAGKLQRASAGLSQLPFPWCPSSRHCLMAW